MKAFLDADPARRGRGRRRVGRAAFLPIAVVLMPLAMAVPPGARADDAPPARMTVTGRVLDPSGKPVPDAAVMVVVTSKLSDRPTLNQFFGPMTIHQGHCDGSGRFGVEVPRTTSARHDRLLVTAMATGYGIGWAEIGPDADPPATDITLRAEQVIRGRLFDVQGQPARGVALRVQGMIPDVNRGLARIIRPVVLERPWRDLPAWPGPAVSDEQGRFTLRGLGRGPTYMLFVDDPRFGIQTAMLRTDDNDNARPVAAVVSQIKVEPGPDPKPIAIALEPARTITGRVTFADTGQPVPHALIAFGLLRYQADDQGRFRAAAPAIGARLGRFNLRAQSPDGAPYLIAMKRGEWPKGSVEQSVDIALTRGVVVRGKITEEGTGRPIAGAVVCVTPNAASGGRFVNASNSAATGPDGSYCVAEQPGPGYLIVQGPDDDYVLREFGGDGGQLTAAPGRGRYYAHAYRAVELKAGGPEQEVDLSLRRGAAIRGRVVGLDSQPVREASVFSRVLLESSPMGGWKVWGLPQDSRGVFDGRFALHGLAADVEVSAYFLEPGRKLGATARFSGRSAAAGPATVRLEPCGTARARLVTPDGKPLDRYSPGNLASMVVTPGPPYGRSPAKDGPLFADESPLFRIDPVHYGDDFQSDAQGRVTFPALIPGASYRLVDRTPLMDGGEPVIRKEFTVKPGEALDLGDILVAKPVRRN